MCGLNHVAFFTKFKKRMSDGTRQVLYPRFRELARNSDFPDDDAVRFEVLNRFGYFVIESSIHFSEYSPWFIKRGREDLLQKFNLPLVEYITRCEDLIVEWHELRHEPEAETHPIEVCQSNEYAADVIHSCVTSQPSLIYGNVRNNGLIENLPRNAAVEVPCHVDRNGIQPVRVGAVPVQLAAIMPQPWTPTQRQSFRWLKLKIWLML